MTKTLTDKEEAFCQAYVNDPETRWNKTQSAVKAGYSEHSARQIAHDTLSKQYVKDRVNQLCVESRDTNGQLINQVIDEYRKLAFKEEDDQIKVAGLKGLAQYLGMDKQVIEHTGDMAVTINVTGVKSD